MYYQKYPPHPALGELVECYWTMHNLGSDSRVDAEQVVADPGIELFFNFGAPYLRTETDASAAATKVAGSHLVGLRTRSILVNQSGHIHIFGIRFRPWGLALLVRLPLAELTHRVYGLRELFAASWGELEDSLAACKSDGERVRLANRFLLDAFGKAAPGDTLAATVAAAIVESGGETPVGRLCSQTGVSYKRLERAFLREVGVGPKLYSRIVRFQRSASRITATAVGRQTLPDGYYDQSHFIREFESFAGESPQRFFKRRQRISGYLLDRDRASNSYNTGMVE